jgi:hypothetical protein
VRIDSGSGAGTTSASDPAAFGADGTTPGTSPLTVSACPGEKPRALNLITGPPQTDATTAEQAVAEFATATGLPPADFTREALPPFFAGMVTVVEAQPVVNGTSPPGTARDATNDLVWYVHRTDGRADFAVTVTKMTADKVVVFQGVGCPTAVATTDAARRRVPVSR